MSQKWYPNCALLQIDPSEFAHCILPNRILNFNHTIFNITHSYFSSPITISTTIKNYFLPSKETKYEPLSIQIARNWICTSPYYKKPSTKYALGKIGCTKQSKNYHNSCYARHPLEHNSTLLNVPFQDTHTIIYFDADSISYNEPTIPINLHKTP
jgi:hypothetical protein